jgi:hypothetical protein
LDYVFAWIGVYVVFRQRGGTMSDWIDKHRETISILIVIAAAPAQPAAWVGLTDEDIL